jgi:hypothetical protein
MRVIGPGAIARRVPETRPTAKALRRGPRNRVLTTMANHTAQSGVHADETDQSP